VHDPKAWEGQVLVSERERAAFHRLLALELKDSFRLFEQTEKSFTWWDYRMNAFKRRMGMRIDHILISPALAARCTRCQIDLEPRGWERPSDHTDLGGVQLSFPNCHSERREESAFPRKNRFFRCIFDPGLAIQRPPQGLNPARGCLPPCPPHHLRDP
jgi:hypothetical protein